MSRGRVDFARVALTARAFLKLLVAEGTHADTASRNDAVAAVDTLDIAVVMAKLLELMHGSSESRYQRFANDAIRSIVRDGV